MKAQDNFTISIPKDLIHSMEAVTFPGTIKLIDTVDEAEKAVDELMKHAVVGFDTETKPLFHRGRSNKVALMQVSTSDTAYLFRLNKIGIADCLLRFMESEKVSKIGLSLRDDFFVMHRSGEFEPKGFIDLQQMVTQYHIADSSLQRIYAIIFGERISKSQRLSNWEAASLTPAQQAYAAIDAWACLKIYNHLLAGEFHPEESNYIAAPEQTEE